MTEQLDQPDRHAQIGRCVELHVLGTNTDERSPGSTRPAGSMFIGGVPMNWATKTVAGRGVHLVGVPSCSIRPRFMTATCVPMVIAST